MISAIQKKEDHTIILTVTIPSDDVMATRKQVVEELAKSANVPGFRKGKAPAGMVEDKLDPEAIREEILKKLLSKYYIQAVEEHKVQPIVTPKIHIQAVEEGKDWQFTATTCELPPITLGKYQEKVKAVTAKSKIVIPGKEKLGPSLDEIIPALLGEVTAVIPHILVEQEVDRLLSRLLDDIKRLGLTLDQYLGSTSRTIESLRAEYEKKAENDIKLEFVLNKIAEDEKLVVEPKEVDEAIQKASAKGGSAPGRKDELESNKYLLASILRQQKTLDFLKNL